MLPAIFDACKLIISKKNRQETNEKEEKLKNRHEEVLEIRTLIKIFYRMRLNIRAEFF